MVITANNGADELFQFAVGQGAPHVDIIPQAVWAYVTGLNNNYSNAELGEIIQGDWNLGEIERMSDGKYRGRLNGGAWSIPDDPMMAGVADSIVMHQTDALGTAYAWVDNIQTVSDLPSNQLSCYLRPTSPEDASLAGSQWGKAYDLLIDLPIDIREGDRVTVKRLKDDVLEGVFSVKGKASHQRGGGTAYTKFTLEKIDENIS